MSNTRDVHSKSALPCILWYAVYLGFTCRAFCDFDFRLPFCRLLRTSVKQKRKPNRRQRKPSGKQKQIGKPRLNARQLKTSRLSKPAKQLLTKLLQQQRLSKKLRPRPRPKKRLKQSSKLRRRLQPSRSSRGKKLSGMWALCHMQAPYV